MLILAVLFKKKSVTVLRLYFFLYLSEEGLNAVSLQEVLPRHFPTIYCTTYICIAQYEKNFINDTFVLHRDI